MAFRIDAGQTIAIVGSKEGETYCDFSIMVNGGRLNPETFVELKSHKLRRHVNLHPLPPEVLLQISVHFSFARMDGVRRFMSFSQDIQLHL